MTICNVNRDGQDGEFRVHTSNSKALLPRMSSNHYKNENGIL